MIRTLLLAFILVATSVNGAKAQFSHRTWDQLLQDHVQLIDGGRMSLVDYRAMKMDERKLAHYLDAVSEVKREQFDRWSKDDQLAFLINAYNAWTVKLILTEYPDLESIKDLGFLFKSPWKKKFIPLLDDKQSLDDIEHGFLSVPPGDTTTHASISR